MEYKMKFSKFDMRFLLKEGSFKTIKINWSPHGNMTLWFLNIEIIDQGKLKCKLQIIS